MILREDDLLKGEY
jgi:hypothetical protein